jgi:hypothetical protein
MICGYDFCKDENTLNPTPLSSSNYNFTMLKNGIFSHWYVTNNAEYPYSSDEPTVWDYLTIMNANLNGNLQAGNISLLGDDIEGIKIKRRKINSYDWITLKYIPVDELFESTTFSFNDYLNQNDTTYEYAFVPIINGVEENYITNTIASKFEGVFICDSETIYKFYNGVQYGNLERVQKIGVLEPFGSKYPVVVSNGMINYSKASLKGTILNNDFENSHIIRRKEIVEKRETLLNFFTNKKAKILKDWNGNFWLMIIVDSPSVEFVNNYGMGIADISANWVEIGDPYNQQDLYNTGLLIEGE